MSGVNIVKYLLAQTGILLVLVVLSLFLFGREGAIATLMGSLIAVIPNAYFALQAFRYNAAEAPQKALSAWYRGAAGKMALVMLITALTFRFLTIENPALLFITLALMLALQPVLAARFIHH